MKKIILFIFIIIYPTLNIYSQVGINTEDPQHLLHVSGGSVSTTDDDVVVTNSGTVGIGTISPNSLLKLDVRGDARITRDLIVNRNMIIGGNLTAPKIGLGTTNPQTLVHIIPGSDAPLRLSNTTEQPGYLLTSDNLGNAFWGALRPMSSRLEATVDSIGANNIGIVIPKETVTNVTLTKPLVLTPGKWLVFARVVTAEKSMSGFYMYLYLYEGNTAINKVGAYGDTKTPYKVVNQLMHLIEVPYSATSGITYTLRLSTSEAGGKVAPRFGNYFYAVRLDR